MRNEFSRRRKRNQQDRFLTKSEAAKHPSLTSVSKTQRRKQATEITKLKRALRDAQFKRWAVKGSWKHGYPKGDPQDWRSWRSRFSIPILFTSEQDAWDYINNHMFKNMGHLRKCSCSVETVWLKEG